MKFSLKNKDGSGISYKEVAYFTIILLVVLFVLFYVFVRNLVY